MYLPMTLTACEILGCVKIIAYMILPTMLAYGTCDMRSSSNCEDKIVKCPKCEVEYSLACNNAQVPLYKFSMIRIICMCVDPYEYLYSKSFLRYPSPSQIHY